MHTAWRGKRGEKWGKKGGRKGVRKCTRKTLILVPLWFRYSLVAFQVISAILSRYHMKKGRKRAMPSSVAVRLRFRVRFGNRNVHLNDFQRYFCCGPHGEGKETYLCQSTDRVRFRLCVPKYGRDWSWARLDSGFLLDESALESQTQNSTRTAPYSLRYDLEKVLRDMGRHLALSPQDPIPWELSCFELSKNT